MRVIGEWSHSEMAQRLGVKRPGIDASAYRRMLRLDPCVYCGAPYRFGSWREVDHIQARASGGPDRWWNYASACRFCNTCKSDRPVLEWLLMLREFEQEFAWSWEAQRFRGD